MFLCFLFLLILHFQCISLNLIRSLFISLLFHCWLFNVWLHNVHHRIFFSFLRLFFGCSSWFRSFRSLFSSTFVFNSTFLHMNMRRMFGIMHNALAIGTRHQAPGTRHILHNNMHFSLFKVNFILVFVCWMLDQCLNSNLSLFFVIQLMNSKLNLCEMTVHCHDNND